MTLVWDLPRPNNNKNNW